MSARLAQPKTLQQGRADLEPLPDEIVQPHAHRDNVAPESARLNHSIVVGEKAVDLLPLNERDFPVPGALELFRESTGAFVVAVADDAAGRFQNRHAHRLRLRAGPGGYVDGIN
jgi:hypothetical protein